MKELRERTGAGMMDCKKALGETGGEMEAAIDWLRTKGLAAAAKKAGRTAAEGLVGVTVRGTKGAVVEVNSETDFVAKNDQFQDFVRTVAGLALETGSDVEALAASLADRRHRPGKTDPNIATIGETSRSSAAFSRSRRAVVSHRHNAVVPASKIGCWSLESEATRP